jgi:uncharacterized membrane protein YccC
MSSAPIPWKSLRTKVLEHRAQLGLAVRVTIAAVVAYGLSHLLYVPLPLWTVLTAVILTQVTFGRSVKATVDYLVGTVGGAIYAGAVSVLIPHANDVSLAGVLVIAVAPLALLGAIMPSFSAAPFTGALVLLVPGLAHVGPIESAIDRVLEVVVGGVTAVVVSLLVFPARAHALAIEAAARALELMAKSLPQLFEGFLRPLDSGSIGRIQDAFGEAVGQTQSIAAEARHERISLLAADPDLRTVAQDAAQASSRLRHARTRRRRAASRRNSFAVRTAAVAHCRVRSRSPAPKRGRAGRSARPLVARGRRSRLRRLRTDHHCGSRRGPDAPFAGRRRGTPFHPRVRA